jgi:hypothetical protein
MRRETAHAIEHTIAWRRWRAQWSQSRWGSAPRWSLAFRMTVGKHTVSIGTDIFTEF